jgi:hypothetical protein
MLCSAYEFELVDSGMSWPLTDHVAIAATHQTWLRDPVTDAYVLDVFREPHDGDTWICRRDSSIRRPYSEVVRHDRGGLPFVSPEIVLLFKAKHVRPKDVDDFEGPLPLLDREAHRWLIDALKRVHRILNTLGLPALQTELARNAAKKAKAPIEPTGAWPI